MSLGPIVTGTSLSENKVIGSKQLTKWSSSNRVHGSGFKVHEDGSWDIPASSCLVEVDINSLKLKIGVPVVGSGGVDSVFVRDDLPELSTNLVTALTSLDVYNFSHNCFLKIYYLLFFKKKLNFFYL